MFSRNFSFFLIIFTLLLFTPAHGEMSLNISSSVDTFNYDLDNIHLKLEKLSTRWQLSPLDGGKLLVDRLKAKRLIVTIRDVAKKTSEPLLPNRINLPVPIKIEQAEIAEVVIVTANGRQILNNVQFNFEGDTKTLHLKLIHASTPWGDTAATLGISTTKPFPLTGVVMLNQTSGDIPYDVKTLVSGDLNTLHFESNALLADKNGKLAIQQDFKLPGKPIARITTNGQLSLTENYPIAVKARITELHPELLGDYPAALLNFDLDLQGKLQPTPSATLQFAVQDSQWQGQPLSGAGSVRIIGKQIQNMDIQANVANNRMRATGTLGQPDSRLEWQADLPDLTAFGKQFAGEARANGVLEGDFNNWALQFDLLAQKLRLSSDLKIEKLEGKATLTAGETGKVEGNLKASTIEYGKHPAMDGQATLQGTRAHHELLLKAQGKDQQFESTLQGGLSASNLWQGFLQQLTYTGKTPVKLTAPAPLRIDSDGITLEQANLQLNNGRAQIKLLQLAHNKLISKGQLEQLSLADLPPGLLKLPETIKGSPAFAARWNIQAGDSLNGDFSLWRESGDFTLQRANGTSTPLGLTEARIDLALINNLADLTTRLDGQNLGNLSAKLATTLTKTDAGFALVASSPFTLNGSAQLHSLAWLPLPTSLMDADVDGQFTLSVEANGTLGKPNLSGNVNGKNLSFSFPSEGVNLNNGIFQATFKNDQLHIEKASWQGGSGSLNSSGNVRMDNGKPRIDLDWTADKFTILSRTDRLLTLSGTGKTSLADGILSIFGKFIVNKGLIELVTEDAPKLGDDVVILGQSTVMKEPPLQILLNGLHIDLGEDFTLRGRGLNAELTGALTFTGLTQYRPHTEGGIQVKKGTYMAYGQVLSIERGILNFNGPMDNPGLNIRAMRNSKPVNAGVEITGSAFIPITRLVSDPDVPESEKLSWLVLGHGMDQAGKNEYSMLSLAAGVLLSQNQSVPLQTQLARAAGLDEFSFAGGDAESASLTFGKRLTSQLYLSYEKSISGLLDVAKLTFNITPRWSLRAEAGTESAVDVLYTFSFK